MDLAVSTLLDDLESRGLLETTLVAMFGEFGRTPIINKNAGRDHWSNVFSVLLAGGGLRAPERSMHAVVSTGAQQSAVGRPSE